MHYADLARDPVQTVHRVCALLDEPYATERLSGDWRQTDTHILGGNPAIIAQVSGDDGLAFAVPPARYLDGKYADKAGQIFYDERWRQDTAFVEDCRREYRRREADLRPLLERLGYEFDVLVAELDAAS